MFKRVRMSVRSDAPTQPSEEQISLGSYTTFAAAQGVADNLTDLMFEDGEQPQVVGSDLRLEVRAMSGLARGKAVLLGAISGACIALLVVLLLTLLRTAAELPALIGGLMSGGVLGAVFVAAGFALSSGRHRYVSITPTAPSRFEILVTAADGERCRLLLASLPPPEPRD